MVYLSKKKWLVKIIKVKNKIETLGINTKLNIDYFAKKYEKN